MKKIISVVLTLSLIISFCPYALAADDNNYDVIFSIISDDDIVVPESEILAILPAATEYDAMYNQVLTDLTDLRSACVEPELCTPVSVGQDGLVRYSITYSNGIVNQISTERNADGSIVLHFYEDDIHNEVVFLENGNLLVDGQLVDIQNNTSSTQLLANSGGIVAPQMRNADYSTKPWGKPSDYTKYLRVYSGNKCSWGVSTLVGLTTGTVASIICAAIKAALGYGIAYSIFSSVAAEMITRCKVYGMEDALYSWKFKMYERKDSMAVDRYYKYTGHCYSRRDFKGYAFAHTYYCHNWFS